MGNNGSSALVEAWRQQSVWSQAANRVKTSISRARLLALLLGVCFAVLGAASAQVMDDSPAWGRSLAFAAAIAAGLTPLVGQHATPQRVRDWTRLRSISEGLKAEVYARLAGGSVYRAADPDALLVERVEQLQFESADLTRYTAELSPVLRDLPAIGDLVSYMETRVKGQINNYYLPRAQQMRSRLAVVRRVEFTFGALTTVLAAVGGAFEVAFAGMWLAVAATAGTAVTAYAATGKYDYQELEFSRTASELERTYQRWLRDLPMSPEDEDRLIEHCEGVISVQNEAWMVKWQGE
ncbi:DUF4231 domain-containing protein [Streptomyces rugosispiralis]|uniref:DUF4231 domain-containing protein n=1 Tax=Streptomyces rugosispiralis TaxID=2967341 RepID=A0ABT1V036_9ACTN|nr:DUF4231 domain-containing protein [Streptomyces rugosispiralis]MCQ8190169.1 DUF4231 domain-containing protein [Streptomyces rugosispiralis]